jgi:FkbH-like protein
VTQELFKAVTALRKQGRSPEALALLREAVRRGQLDAEGMDRAGRFIHKELRQAAESPKPMRVWLLGQFTTSWVATALTATAWGHQVPLLVTEGAYDNILQELALPAPADGRPDVVVLLPWQQRLLSGSESTAQRIEEELEFWRRAWDQISNRLVARLLQVGYDWVVPGAGGHHLAARSDGAVDRVRRMNAALRDQLPRRAFFLDLEQVSGTVGRAAFYDMRRYFWTKQPFSEAGACRLAEHLWAGIRALTTGPKKVVVVDLDNTLWGGVVGETGPLGIALGDDPEGEAFQAFQRHLKELARRGVLLAVASKNNPRDAREPFEKNPDMILRLDDFAAFEACWDPKSVMLARLAQTLNLGLDSFVFYDDNPAEREQIRQALPDVAVAEVPADPAEYVRALQAGLWFETAGLTQEDMERAEQYVVERKRRELQTELGSIDDYLASLEMVADVRPITETDLQRVVQLLAKTNQFNVTTRRHTGQDLDRLLALPGAIGLTLRVRDRFGDYGLVGVLLGVPRDGQAAPTLHIDTWLMSCRVIGRTIEHFLLGVLLDRCSELGYHTLLGEYIPTKKNALVRGLYDDLLFQRLGENGDSSVWYKLDVATARRPVTFVTAGVATP